jgi:hypothetical protein
LALNARTLTATGAAVLALAGCTPVPVATRASAPASIAPVAPTVAPPKPATVMTPPPSTVAATRTPAAPPKTAVQRAPPKPVANTATPARPAPPPAASPPPSAPAVAAVTTRTAAPALNLGSLEQRLKDTHAIGVFTKLSLKNQVDDLLGRFRDFYGKKSNTTLAELRQKYDLLLLKALSVLQDGDPALASAISASREAIWGILADPQKFSKL